MSTDRCPNCHSGDTRPAYGNYAGKALKLGAGFAAAFLLHGTPFGNGAHGGFHSIMDEEIKKHHCNMCGYEW